MDERRRAAGLAEGFERSLRALRTGGAIEIREQTGQISMLEQPFITSRLDRAQRLWDEAIHFQVRILRSQNREIARNPDLQAFRERTKELRGLLQEVGAFLEDERAEIGVWVRITQVSIPFFGSALVFLLAYLVHIWVVRPLDTTMVQLASAKESLEQQRDKLEHALQKVTDMTKKVVESNTGG